MEQGQVGKAGSAGQELINGKCLIGFLHKNFIQILTFIMFDENII